MNTQNIDLNQVGCIKEVNKLLSTDYHNICNGAVTTLQNSPLIISLNIMLFAILVVFVVAVTIGVIYTIREF